MFNNIKERTQKKIAMALIRWYLSGGFKTKRGHFIAHARAKLRGENLRFYADEEQSGVTIVKQALVYLPWLVDEFFPDFDETTLKKPESVFIIHMRDAIIKGLRTGQESIRDFREKWFDDESRGFNNEDVTSAIEIAFNLIAITMEADTYYEDIVMNSIFFLFQGFRNFQATYDAEFIEKYGMDWLDWQMGERKRVNCEIGVLKIKQKTGRDVEVIKDNGKYKIVEIMEAK